MISPDIVQAVLHRSLGSLRWCSSSQRYVYRLRVNAGQQYAGLSGWAKNACEGGCEYLCTDAIHVTRRTPGKPYFAKSIKADNVVFKMFIPCPLNITRAVYFFSLP